LRPDENPAPKARPSVCRGFTALDDIRGQAAG
jgi:hypothetical protein